MLAFASIEFCTCGSPQIQSSILIHVTYFENCYLCLLYKLLFNVLESGLIDTHYYPTVVGRRFTWRSLTECKILSPNTIVTDESSVIRLTELFASYDIGRS